MAPINGFVLVLLSEAYMSWMMPILSMRKMMVIGRIDLKRAETIKKNNDEGGFRKNIRTAKAYIVTRGR